MIRFKQNTFHVFSRKELNSLKRTCNALILEETNQTQIEIGVFFLNDEKLYQYNLKYLQHDYFTDIITFEYSKLPFLEGDLLISIDRVQENAKVLKTPLKNELKRVVFHGLLHLCGYKDKSSADKRMMRKKEEYYLSLPQLTKVPRGTK